MVINGLIPFLKEASRRANVYEFAGKAVAIDSYSLLQKAASFSVHKMPLGEHTNMRVNYCMMYVNMLLSYTVMPILVFDGRHLPAKAQIEAKRQEDKSANRAKAVELIKMGRDEMANDLMERTLDVTHETALELIKECQRFNIDCIVAPYEADSQLAYLNLSGIVDAIITEDSDLLLYGCKKVLFKMDIKGRGLLIEQKELYRAMDISREDFNMDDFIHMCILSGCDYLPPLRGIRLYEARRFIKLNTNCDIHYALTRLGWYLNRERLDVTQEYRDAFILAIISFKYQLVYCPLSRRQVRLNPPPPSVTSEQLKHAGEETDPETAFQLALGNYDPFTLEKLHDFDPDKAEDQAPRHTWYQRPSIWSKKWKLTSSSEDSPPEENSALKSSNQQEILNVCEPGGSVHNKSYSNSLTNVYGKRKNDTRWEQVGSEKGQQSILNYFQPKQKF